MANQAKSVPNGEENNSEFDGIKGKDMIYGGDETGKANCKERVAPKSCLFVKVNMDGVAIGRKVDLNAHPSYESLARMLEEMFTNRAVESMLLSLCSLYSLYCFVGNIILENLSD